MKSFGHMTGKKVCILAGNVVYRGVLIQMSEDHVELQGETQWITLPMENISSISLDENQGS